MHSREIPEPGPLEVALLLTSSEVLMPQTRRHDNPAVVAFQLNFVRSLSSISRRLILCFQKQTPGHDLRHFGARGVYLIEPTVKKIDW